MKGSSSRPLAALFLVPGLALPAWLVSEGRAWTAGVVAARAPGGAVRFCGAPVDLSVLALDESARSLAFPAFGQAGAAMEFLRLVGAIAQRTAGGSASHPPNPLGLWRPPDPVFTVRPACPRHGRVDPADMARLAMRLFFEAQSSGGSQSWTALSSVVRSTVVSEDRAGAGFYDGFFASQLQWLALAERDPGEAVRLLPAANAAALRPAMSDYGGLLTGRSPGARYDVRATSVRRQPSSAASIAAPAMIVSGLSEAAGPAVRDGPTRPAARTDRITDPDFHPGIVAGIEIGGVCLHAHEIGEVSALADMEVSDHDGSACMYRTYRIVVTIDPSSIKPTALQAFFTGHGTA